MKKTNLIFKQYRPLLLMFVAILGSGNQAFAEIETENKVIISRPKASEIYSDSSEYHRMNKKISLLWQAIGVGPNAAPSGGLAIGFHLNSNSLLILDATTSAQKTTLIGSEYDIKTSSVGVHYKQFLGNSFYVKGGVDQRRISYNYNYKSIFSNSSEFNESHGFEGTSTSAGVLIGNQWQWDNFTLGCDWIGVSVPFASKVEKEYYNGYEYSTRRSEQESDKNRYLKDSIAQGLRFYLGASF